MSLGSPVVIVFCRHGDVLEFVEGLLRDHRDQVDGRMEATLSAVMSVPP
jgi:hypothetical protein